MLKTVSDIERLEAVAAEIDRLVEAAPRQRLAAREIEELMEAAMPLLLPREQGDFHNACAALLWEPSSQTWRTLAAMARRFRRRAVAARRRIERREKR